MNTKPALLEGVKLISKLKLHNYFDVRELLTKLVNQDKLPESAILVESCENDLKPVGT